MKRCTLVVWSALLCLTAVQGQTVEEKKATVDYLKGLQTKEGSFAPAKTGPMADPTLRSTSTGARALRYWGAATPNADGAAKYVASCFDKASGGFAPTPGGKPDVFTTAVGLMVVVDLKMPLDQYADPAVKFLFANAKSFEDVRIGAAALDTIGKRPAQADDWLKEIVKLRNPDGTFGKGTGQARETGGAVAGLLRLGGKVEQRDAVVKALKAGQRADGGFGKEESPGSDLETCYRVMRCFHMLKEKPDDAKLRGFIAKCRNADGGYGVAPGSPSNMSGTYFAGIILYWLDQK
jgi:prenyltransferase beta subunit